MGPLPPFELRALAARRPDVVCAIDRILFREIQRWMRAHAGPRDGRAGALTFVQRFGGSLNLHVHFHVLVLEGLFTRAEARSGSDADATTPPVFHPSFAPTRADLQLVVARVHDAVERWLRRNQLHPRDDASAGADHAPDALDALSACANTAVQQGLFDKLPGAPLAPDSDDDLPASPKRSVAHRGYNLHAAVAIGADDDESRERLVRYCARPPFALERLTVLPDGRIAYRIKHPRKNATHRILEPIELLARIAALIPPPRHPFLRYHGVLAPNSKWRSAVVPRLPPSCESERAPKGPATHCASASDAAVRTTPVHSTDARPTKTAAIGATPSPDAPTAPNRASCRDHRPTPATRGTRGAGAGTNDARYALVTTQHRARTVERDVFARAARLEWSRLLRRTFAVDVLSCPRCTGRARIVAAVQDPAAAVRFLDAIMERSTPAPSGARRRDEYETPDAQSAPEADAEVRLHAAPDDELDVSVPDPWRSRDSRRRGPPLRHGGALDIDPQHPDHAADPDAHPPAPDD